MFRCSLRACCTRVYSSLGLPAHPSTEHRQRARPRPPSSAPRLTPLAHWLIARGGLPKSSIGPLPSAHRLFTVSNQALACCLVAANHSHPRTQSNRVGRVYTAYSEGKPGVCVTTGAASRSTSCQGVVQEFEKKSNVYLGPRNPFTQFLTSILACGPALAPEPAPVPVYGSATCGQGCVFEKPSQALQTNSNHELCLASCVVCAQPAAARPRSC